MPKDPPAGEDPATTISAQAGAQRSTTPRLQVRLDSSPNNNPGGIIAARGAPSSCAQCNRAFCLRYNLPICKDAEEKDVTTMCFQRDSHKDQIIVWGFILGTVGLLGWAGVRRVVEMRDARAAARSGIGGGGGLGSSSGGRTRSGWTGFMRRRGSPVGGGGLSPREDASRGMYSPIGNLYDGDGDGRAPG